MNSVAIAFVAASMICSGGVLQANIINSQLNGGYLYGGGGYGPKTYQRISLIGGPSVQAPAATASFTSSAVVALPSRRLYRPVGFAESAAMKKSKLLERLFLRKSQKLVDYRAVELQRSQPGHLQRCIFAGRPNCYSSHGGQLLY